VFGDAAVDAFLAHLVELEPDFEPATIGEAGETATLRRNLTCGLDARFFDPADDDADFDARIARRGERSPLLHGVDSLLMSPALREVFDSAPWPLCKLAQVNRWETQVSRYGEGGEGSEYGWHLDRIGDDGRLISIAYYVCEDPPPFDGGELDLCDGLVRHGALLSDAEVARVEPARDRAVFFGARCVHRVRPTFAPTRSRRAASASTSSAGSRAACRATGSSDQSRWITTSRRSRGVRAPVQKQMTRSS